MKKALIICLALILTFSMIACAKTPQNNEQPAEPVRVAALAGPTGMGLAYMMQDMQDRYTVELFTAPDQVTAKIINGEVDIAAVPINLASVLCKKTEGKVNVIAINTLGVLYVLENGNTINSIADLAGKTIWSTGEGSTPEYILNYLLEANGLTDSVKVEYISDNAELIAKLADGSAEVALLPEPHVSIATAQNENVRVALKVNDLWSEKNDTKLLQGVYIVRSDYLASNKEQVDAFLKDAAESAKKVVSEEDAAAVVVAQGIIGKEPIAKRAIPNCNITLITGSEMKVSVSAMLKVLFDANPKSIGGAMPGDDFYYVPDPS
ncbi:MAG: ABC transporter substrate-binding protein [Clostridia bacterium]|nr:ABC transporter substrate-binding protein [Clostridia bacterium]